MSSNPPIGSLNQPVDIERRTLRQDDQGGVDYNAAWEVVFPGVWIRDNARALSQVLGDGSIAVATQHRVTCRYRPGVEEGMRLNLGGGVYWLIQTVADETGERRWLSLTCEEPPTGGA